MGHFANRDPVLHRLYLNSSQINKLINEYEAGATTKKLGARYGIHRTTVSAIQAKQRDPALSITRA